MTPPAGTPRQHPVVLLFEPVGLIQTLTLRKKTEILFFLEQIRLVRKPTPTLTVIFPQERLPVK